MDFRAQKGGAIDPGRAQERYDIGDIYLWTALDQKTKLIPAFLVGKRSADNARRFLRDVAGRLRFPTAHDSDPHHYQPGGYSLVVQISSDAFRAYPEAVDLAFGPYCKYGQIIKNYRNADQPGRYAPPEMVETERTEGVRVERRRGADNMHVPRGTPQLDRPHLVAAVHSPCSGILQKTREPRGGVRGVSGVLQLRLANQIPG